MLRINIRIVLMVLVGLLAACGLGKSTSSTSSSSSSGANGSGNTVNAYVNGVAATSSPIINGKVTVTDIDSVMALGKTNSSGAFNINVNGMRAPFLLRIDFTDYTGAMHTLYSYAMKAGTANINPMSNTAVTASAGTSTVTFASLAQASFQNNIAASIASLQEKLGPILNQYVAEAINPISGSYTLGSSLDLFFDLVTLNVSGATLTINNSYDGSVIATAPLKNLQSLALQTNPNWAVEDGSITVNTLPVTSGDVGTHIVITGTGYNPNLADVSENYILIGGIKTNYVALLDITNTIIGFEAIVPPRCVGGSVAIVRTSTDKGPVVGFSPNFLTVTNQFDYAIGFVSEMLGNINLTSCYFPAETTLTVNIAQIGINPIAVQAVASLNAISIKVPPELDITKSYNVWVTSTDGTKTSNVFTVTP